LQARYQHGKLEHKPQQGVLEINGSCEYNGKRDRE
jgi:hypothetical protein